MTGLAMLAILPLSTALFALGAGRSSSPAATLTVEHRSGPAKPDARPDPMISLAPPEPVIAAHRDLAAPVILPGILLPADTPEEPSDGGH